jgi:hypothetical protein
VAVADALFMALFTHGWRYNKKSLVKTNNVGALNAINNPIFCWLTVIKNNSLQQNPVECWPYEPTQKPS